MTGDPRPIIPRSLADQDIDDAITHYLREAGPPTAARFVNALERSFERVGRHPAAGSPRLAVELDIPGLRTQRVIGFPHQIFYVERPDHIDVWRVLHGRRDLSQALQEPRST